MSFKMKYTIKKDYIPAGTKRRGGTKLTGGKPTFGVVHDTGNPGSTANGNVSYYKNSRNAMNASAHTFIDDNVIIECIPATTAAPEKAWHVLYNVPTDNQKFGDDANDRAIGVELCYGSNINFAEAYKRYVWYCAYVSYKFGFSPTRWVGHHVLDPARKTDPVNALRTKNHTYAQLLKDIVDEYNECLGKPSTAKLPEVKPDEPIGKVTIKVKDLNMREKPSLDSKVIKVLHKDETYNYYGTTGIFVRLKNGYVSNADGKYVTLKKAVKKDTAKKKTHKVTKGETLWGISQKYKTTVAAIVAVNKKLNPNKIDVGDIITIP